MSAALLACALLGTTDGLAAPPPAGAGPGSPAPTVAGAPATERVMGSALPPPWSWEELVLLGTLTSGSERWALLADPSGGQHTARLGMYVDHDWARVHHVGREHVVISWETPFLAAELAVCWGLLSRAHVGDGAGDRDGAPKLPGGGWPRALSVGCGTSDAALAARFPDLLTDSPRWRLEWSPVPVTP